MSKPLKWIDAAGLALFGAYAAQQLISVAVPRPKLPTADQGVNLVFLIPALNEAQVIQATLINLRQTVPEALLVVIDDASDDGTDAIVRNLAASDAGIRLLRRELPNARQNKGKAMNWAVQQLLQDGTVKEPAHDTVFIGIDADGRIGPDFTGQVRGAFQDSRVMAAQGWMRYRQELPTSGPQSRGLPAFLARTLLFQQDLENFILGHTQRARHMVGTASLTGNGQCMRASYVARQLRRGVAPWPDVLLEDFGSALEIRLENPENRIAFIDAHVGQQGMLTVPTFVKQRSRWAQGTMECLPYLPRLWRSGTHPATLADFTYLLLGPWLLVVLIASQGSGPLRKKFGWRGLELPAAVGTATSVLPLIFQITWAVRYRKERNLPWTAVPFAVLTLPIYGLISSLPLPLAYYRHFSGQKGWYKSDRHAEDGADPNFPLVPEG